MSAYRCESNNRRISAGTLSACILLKVLSRCFSTVFGLMARSHVTYRVGLAFTNSTVTSPLAEAFEALSLRPLGKPQRYLLVILD